MLDQCVISRLPVNVLSRPGIDDHLIQGAPLPGDLFADLAHGLAVGQIAGHGQYLSWIT
ncbi:hypothetical protein D3C78_1283190 [compost metagenome]